VLPSIQTCVELMEKYRMLDHIKVHSFMVAKTSHLLARRLMQKGIQVSVHKATAGALLHDIGKTPCLNSGCDHSEVGKNICLENNLEELAGIVAEHVILKNHQPGEITEKEIVYYADKRVNHDKIVPLEERLRYILTRYAPADRELSGLIKDNFSLCEQIESEIFARLDFSPDSLRTLLGGETLTC